MNSPSISSRSIVDVYRELNEYADGLDADAFAPWVSQLVRFTAWLIGRGRRREAELIVRDGPGWDA